MANVAPSSPPTPPPWLSADIPHLPAHPEEPEAEAEAGYASDMDGSKKSRPTTVAPSQAPEDMPELAVPGVQWRDGGRIEITEAECFERLGFGFPTWQKWMILGVIFLVQVSMNLNTSVYANAIVPLSEEFNISHQTARVGQMIFLVAYAFGSELWAPWSEEMGRWPVMQLSLFFVNIWQIPCALAPNFGTIIGFRFLGGLSSAGGSVTLGMVADMWMADTQQYAVNFIVLSSVGGSVVGPVIGGYIETYLNWHWNFWIQLLVGVGVQLIHFFLVPETRTTILMDREARRRRSQGEENIYGPGEIRPRKLEIKEILAVWARPFEMFFREPIVLWLSLLSGFSDALIFTFLESYGPVFKQWGFSRVETGLAFIPLLIGYFIAYLSFLPFIHRQRNVMRVGVDALQPEARLYWLLFTVPLEAIGLFGFAWTSLGPPHTHWIAPLLFSTLVAIANFAIYMATIDYMVASYGPYSASATGGNALARDFLAGIAAMYSIPFYENVGHKYHLEWPSTILGIIAALVAIPVYIFYFNGEAFRKRSKFALKIQKERKQSMVHRASIVMERKKQVSHHENV